MSIFDKYPDLQDPEFIEDFNFDVCWTVQNPKDAFSELDVAVALLRAAGNFTEAAQYLNRTRRSMETFVTRDRDLSDLASDIEASFLDRIESRYKTIALGGDPAAIKFFLETIGKNRGYNKRAELSGPDGGPLEMEVSPREILLDKLSGIASSLGADETADESE